jgi:hypothetical protein
VEVVWSGGSHGVEVEVEVVVERRNIENLCEKSLRIAQTGVGPGTTPPLAGAVRPIRFNPKPQRRGGFKKRLKTSGRYLGLVSEYSYFFHPFPISACSAVLDLGNWFAFNSDNLAMRNVRL